jgi:hypothetical protein
VGAVVDSLAIIIGVAAAGWMIWCNQCAYLNTLEILRILKKDGNPE